jgi:hypothetical protein
MVRTCENKKHINRDTKRFNGNSDYMGLTLSFFDIDETVFHSFAHVIVRIKDTGEIVKKLSNDEFNSHILGDDEEYDFSEFQDAKFFKASSKVIASTLREIKKQFKAGNMIIFLTARADMDNNATFKDTFRQQGIRVNDKRIRFELAGNLKYGPIPQRKMYIIGKYIKRYGSRIDEIKIYDDHRENVRILDQLAKKHSEIKFSKYLIKDGKIVKFGQLNKRKEMKSFKEHMLAEEQELEELFGSLPFKIDTTKWSMKHKGQQPKGQGDWKFNFKVPVRSPMASYLDDGEFTFKGMFKKAIQGLVKYLKRSAGPKGDLKQAKVVLQP